MNRLLAKSLERGVTRGNLRVTFADGTVHRYGNGEGSEVAVELTDSGAERELALDPALRLGELYMDDRLRLEAGSCYELIALLKRNARQIATPPAIALHAFRSLTSFAAQRQTLINARQNVAHHYNLDEQFYRLFLDDDMQYTCAYFEHESQSLEAAQLAKKRHIAAKLLLKPEHRVLDIGCGWGGLCLYMAELTGAHTTGVTLSQPQHAVATRRAKERELEEKSGFSLCDYRAVEGKYDRIVSVGMFEAIGLKEFDTFFQKAAKLMTRKGVMVLHSIGRTKSRPVPNPWMEKYIFPGSYIPSLSEVLPAVERAGFLVNDVEILRLHYAETLRHWRQRFLAKRKEAATLYDERFCRMWEFYLAASEAGFRIDRMFIFQLQLTRHLQSVPRRREYLVPEEDRLRKAEAQSANYAT